MNGKLGLLHIENRRSPTRLATLAGQEFALIWLGALFLLLLIILQAWLSSSTTLSFLSPIRLVLGWTYLLYVPGYCLTAALFPHQNDLDGVERTGLSFGLSIAIVPLLALLLDYLPWGIYLWSILLAEYSMMAFCTVIALSRRANLTTESAYAPALSWRPRSWWHNLSSLEQRLYMLLVSVLLIAGLATAWFFLLPSSDEFMTEFYILGQEELAQAYPHQARLGEELSVTMGIINHERDEHRYQVEVWAINPSEDERELVTETSLVLSAGDEEETRLTWAMPWEGDEQKVEFLLFVDNDPAPYRQLRLWLDVVKDEN